MKHPFATVGLCTAALLLALGGCDTSTPITASARPDPGGSPAQPAFARFNDIPVPDGATMDLGRSLVLGDRTAWTGRLVMSVPDDAGRIYDFYFREMPRFEWSKVTSVRAETSVLTYTSGERVATIQIHRSTMGGAAISMTVSPRAVSPANNPPRAARADNTAVPLDVTPLR